MPWRAHHDDFDLEQLRWAKAERGLSVSVCLPARDEAETVGAIVRTVRDRLGGAAGLVDEVVVLDDSSTDATRAVAARAGARVVEEASLLAECGPGSGKGNAMWKSVFTCEGDVLCWVDADIRDFAPHFVTGLLGPLLTRPDVGFVKGFYDRTLHGQPGGGRVTELVARPLLSHLFPQLARVVQPLGGEYAGRRDVLDAVPFVEGWGVELGLLIDVVARIGLDGVAQVDLGTRVHRNRPLEELAPQALAVLVTGLRRAGLDPAGRDLEQLVRFTDAHALECVPVELRERPPLRTVAAYRAAFDLELSA